VSSNYSNVGLMCVLLDMLSFKYDILKNYALQVYLVLLLHIF